MLQTTKLIDTNFPTHTRTNRTASSAGAAAAAAGATHVLVRDVVLLTTDRNLRVKALAQNVPVRQLSNFIRWSGLVEAEADWRRSGADEPSGAGSAASCKLPLDSAPVAAPATIVASPAAPASKASRSRRPRRHYNHGHLQRSGGSMASGGGTD